MTLLADNEADVTLFYSAPGQSGFCENTMVIARTDATDFDQAALDATVGLWGSTIMSSLDAQVVLIGGHASAGTGASFDTSSSIPGDGSATMLPLIGAVLVQKITGVAGRANRGHWFIPGVDTSNVNQDGTFDSGWLSGMQSNCDDFLSGLAVDDVELRLGHPAAVTTTITSLKVVNLISTQRARLRN